MAIQQLTSLAPSYRVLSDDTLDMARGSISASSGQHLGVSLLYDTRGLDIRSISGTANYTIYGAASGENERYISVKYDFVTVSNYKVTTYQPEYSNTKIINQSKKAQNGTQTSGSFSLSCSKLCDRNTYLRLLITSAPGESQAVNINIDDRPKLDITYDDTNSSGGGGSGGGGSGGGGSDQTPTVKALPSSPSGGGVSFSTTTTFSWSISSIPDGAIYSGTQIQMTKATDTTGSEIFYDTVVAGLTTQYIYTGSLDPNTDYIWRARSVIENNTHNSSTGNDEYSEYDEIYYEDEPIYDDGTTESGPTTVDILTPWSDWKSFTTKDYEYVTVRVTASSPESDASFVEGKQISFRWSISGGSGVSIESSDLIIDGYTFATIQGTGTSYTYSGSSDGRLGQGAHVWYVAVNVSTENNGVQITGTPSSDRSTFYVNPPTATATPSSPSGSSTVYGNAPVTFSWSISKDGDGNYTGSQLEYRYSTETAWRFLGETEKGITSFTFQKGFTANTIVQWHVRTGLEDVYATNGGWSEPASFAVGDNEVYKATPSLIAPKGTIKGDEPITFAWTVKSDGEISSCELEYSDDGGINWTLLTRINQNLATYTYTSARLLPAGSIDYRVRAKANGIEYGDWVQSSFTVNYDAYGAVEVDTGSLRSAARRDQQFEIKANLHIIGRTTETITFKQATFCWRMASGTDYREESMVASGTKANIYLPANKFPVGVMYWYLKAEDSKDNDSETPVQAMYILSSTIDTFPVSPQSIVHEASEQLTFSWGFIAQNENLSKRTEIQFSKDGVTFDPPILISASISKHASTIINPENALVEDLYTGIGEYTFGSEYFSAGRVYWQVRSVSSDDVYGAWSETSLFIVRGIPKIQSFECDGKPFATFQWTVNEQTSYTICIDNAIYYGPFHGDESSFILPEPLLDGFHTATLQVENRLGALSELAHTTFQVRNVASVASTLKLFISAKVDADLKWNPINISNDNEFLVYRDSALIARLKSDVSTYQDRLALGEHSYKVVQRLSSNYYDVYVHDPVTMHSDVTRIGLLGGGSWFNLVLTKDPYPTNDYSQKRIVEKIRIMGTKYPMIEVSEFEEKNGSYAVCWPFENYAQVDFFNSLIGLAVIIKSRGDMVLCGVLESCDFSVNSQYVECTFSLDQMSTDQDLSIAVKPNTGFDFMSNLDKIYFGQMSDTKLSAVATNPGYTNPKYYEDIGKAINEMAASNPFLKRND